MFHLFKKTYLDFSFRFNSQHNSIIGSSDCIQDPLMYEVIGEKPDLLHKATHLDELVNEKFNSNLEELWQYLYDPGDSGRFICYLNYEDYLTLQVSYWKSIFKNLGLDSAYLLHKLHIQDLKIKSLIKVSKINVSVKEYLAQLDIYSVEKFHDIWERTPVSPFVKSLPLEDRSFEYLLANYLPNKNGIYTDAFFKKLKMVSWKVVVSEIDILRTDVMKGIYDYLQYDFSGHKKPIGLENKIENMIEMIKTKPEYLWILDGDIKADNFNYLLECYSEDTFSRFVEHQNIMFAEPLLNGKDDGKLSRIFHLAFAQNYDELLEMDIESGFGSIFFSGHDTYKVNNLFLSFIYEKYRENDYSKLLPFEMYTNDI